MNLMNETEIVIFKDDRIYVLSDDDQDSDNSSCYDDDTDLQPSVVTDIYKPTSWDDIPSLRYRHRPMYWRWASWEVFEYI